MCSDWKRLIIKLYAVIIYARHDRYETKVIPITAGRISFKVSVIINPVLSDYSINTHLRLTFPSKQPHPHPLLGLPSCRESSSQTQVRLFSVAYIHLQANRISATSVPASEGQRGDDKMNKQLSLLSAPRVCCYECTLLPSPRCKRECKQC